MNLLPTAVTRWFRGKGYLSWDPKKGEPPQYVLDDMRCALKSSKSTNKERVLRHIAYLAGYDRRMQSALGTGHVTEDVCACLQSGRSTVQIAAAEALTALCRRHAENCEIVIVTFRSSFLWFRRSLLDHMLRLMRARQNDLAIATMGLLSELLAEKTSELLGQLKQSKYIIGKVVKMIEGWGKQARNAAPSAAANCELARGMLGFLNTMASGGGAKVCRALDKGGVTALCLRLVEECSQQQALVRAAMALLSVMVVQVPAQRLEFEKNEGVQRLLQLLSQGMLDLSVRGMVAEVLSSAASASPKVADTIRLQGLDTVTDLLAFYLHEWLVLGALDPSPDSAELGSSAPAPRLPPCNTEILEPLLRLLATVTTSSTGEMPISDQGLKLLGVAVRAGLAHTAGEGYKVATAAAQVALHLSCKADMPLSPVLCSDDVTGPMIELVDLACRHAAASEIKDARILQGGLCAAGFLSKVLCAKLSSNDVQQVEVLNSDLLVKLVTLLNRSANAVLMAVNPMEPCHAEPVTAEGLGSGLRSTGRTYLVTGKVVADLRTAVPLQLQLLTDLAAGPLESLQVLHRLGAPAAVKQLMRWEDVKSKAAQILNLMDELDLEYKPFVEWGTGPLTAAALSSLQLDPQPFVAQGISSAKILKLRDHDLRTRFGLDQVGINKVALLQDGHKVFTEIEAMDSSSAGSIAMSNMGQYLVAKHNVREPNANALSIELFQEMQVGPMAPASFLNFIKVYPTLKERLDDLMPGQRDRKRARREH
ncbi:hypothetical protein Vretimale_10537 [Volvox reticuliferus]|uniref:Uncharacterized protein n=1 Tax=Volvox reticuliferus TaxID=1737510 RepID=A0A8J4FR35_9CHLO|nr:hypothetical protein Vretifemale_12480 [Volvox reticuliferus]GIM06143.1 hypothetical protein Vretimale_10537 [Volvox reticuliferus]